MHEISARCQAENHPSIIERYEMGVEIARIWGPRIRAVAVANKNLINYLTENTAVNRGARFKVVSDMENGLAWLHSE
jgi:hypothetical protein